VHQHNVLELTVGGRQCGDDCADANQLVRILRLDIMGVVPDLRKAHGFPAFGLSNKFLDSCFLKIRIVEYGVFRRRSFLEQFDERPIASYMMSLLVANLYAVGIQLDDVVKEGPLSCRLLLRLPALGDVLYS